MKKKQFLSPFYDVNIKANPDGVESPNKLIRKSLL